MPVVNQRLPALLLFPGGAQSREARRFTPLKKYLHFLESEIRSTETERRLFALPRLLPN